MTLPRRSAVLLALVAVLAAAAFAWLWRNPVEGDRVDLARSHPERAAPAEAPRPTVREPMGLDRQVQPVQIAASAPPARVGPPAADVDLGQSVLMAIHGGTPQQAAQAAITLSNCRGMEGLGEKIRKLKPTAKLTPDKLTMVAELTDKSARRCQSISEDMQTHLTELAERALRAGFHEVSTIYGRAVDYRPPEAMRQPLLDGLRKEFFEGGSYMASTLSMEGMKLGLTAVEARAFYIIDESDSGPRWKELHEMAFPGMPFANLSEAEVRQAEALAEQLKQQRKKVPKRYDG
ncbi:hypothetical protein [Roseateles chitinivorans]|uniref:hypothetical protein n=1 Tax=Roseateles chitinivorans TaxID=2917965 RepID=UPI003D669586